MDETIKMINYFPVATPNIDIKIALGAHSVSHTIHLLLTDIIKKIFLLPGLTGVNFQDFVKLELH